MQFCKHHSQMLYLLQHLHINSIFKITFNEKLSCANLQGQETQGR